MRRHPAFSLPEVLLVLVITALVLSLAVPKWLAMSDSLAVRGAVAELTATFATARELAVARRALVAVVLDTARGSVLVRAQGSVVFARSLREVYSVTLNATRDSMSYDPRGLGYGAANLSVVVGRRAAEETLTVSRLGRVRP